MANAIVALAPLGRNPQKCPKNPYLAYHISRLSQRTRCLFPVTVCLALWLTLAEDAALRDDKGLFCMVAAYKGSILFLTDKERVQTDNEQY